MYKRQIPVEFRKNEGSANFFGQKKKKFVGKKKNSGEKIFKGADQPKRITFYDL